VDTLGHLLALRVTAGDVQDREQVGPLLADVPEITDQHGEQGFVDQGYTGQGPAAAAALRGVESVVVRLPAARKGFVPLPRRWVVERIFAWFSRFRRPVRDDERLPAVVAGRHFLAFACLRLTRVLHGGGVSA